MEATRQELAELLAQLDASPGAGSARLRACVLANRAAVHSRDPMYADLAESLATEEGGTASLARALREQAELARAARRSMLLPQCEHDSLTTDVEGLAATA
jgi:cytochrome c551/c552